MNGTTENRASESGHIPVMCSQVVSALAPCDNEIFVDGTFGGGGYSRALLEAANCVVWGVDRDPDAIARGEVLAQQYDGRLKLVGGCFSEMDKLLEERGVRSVDGIALDLGVSSWQLDDPDRGFSFRYDGPLDMRMGGAVSGGLSAADLVNDFDEDELARIFRRYGEERSARRVARAIVAARAEEPITSTARLADIIETELGTRFGGGRPGGRKIHPATKSFQALRIYVNDELGELSRGLVAAERLLGPGGRLAIVAFHSLEDRLVKGFLRQRSGLLSRGSRHRPEAEPGAMPSFELLFRNTVKPEAEEIARNSRSRSARMRAARRTDSPVWPTADQSPDKGATHITSRGAV